MNANLKKKHIFQKHDLTLKICKGCWKKSRISDKKAGFSNQQFLAVVQRR